MPLYEYQTSPDEAGCEHCRAGFQILQSIKDDSLTQCPKCGGPVRRRLFAANVSTPIGNSHLKNIGFTKLVKREEGVYENVTRTGDDARYMERDKPGSIPDLSKKISD